MACWGFLYLCTEQSRFVVVDYVSPINLKTASRGSIVTKASGWVARNTYYSGMEQFGSSLGS